MRKPASCISVCDLVKLFLKQCTTCPDPLTCARLLEEKWKQAYFAVFRFGKSTIILINFLAQTHLIMIGPPQPSMVFRYIRMLEGVSPPLSLTQTACQASAKAFTATCMLFFPLCRSKLRGR